MDVELLITEIEKGPVLWDVRDESYRDRNMKNDGWMDVATVIFENFGEKTQAEQKVLNLISKWRSVRDNYIRSLKKQAECNHQSGSSRKKIQRYIFEEQLSFLKKCRELRPTTSRVQSDLNEQDVHATQLPADNMAIGDESSIDDNINNAEKTVLTPPPIKKNKIDLEEKLALFLDSRQQSSYEPNRDTDDEDLNFYKSTLLIVKTLNMEQKMQFRIQLMQLLQRIVKTNQ